MRSLVVHLEVKADRFREFISIARAHGDNSVEMEDGCLQFEVMLPEDEPDNVILVELYRDQAAVESHLKSDHMAAYLRNTGDMIVSRRRYLCEVVA